MRSWTRFAGESPITPRHLLAEGAQLARDVDLERGTLAPRRDTLPVHTPARLGTKQAIYRFGRDIDSAALYWWTFLAPADVARGLVPDDPAELTFWTEQGQPMRVTDNALALSNTPYPFAGYEMPPQPTQQPSAAITGTPIGTTPATAIVVTYTYVQTIGAVTQESAPCTLPSASVDWQPGQTLTVTNLPVPPGGSLNITSKRLYVAITAEGESKFQFWTAVPAAQTTYSAVFDSTDLAETLQEPYLLPPPAGAHSLIAHPNGFMCLLAGKKFCRSEVNRPHGWPYQYQDPLEHEAVAQINLGAVTVICTTGWTYRAIGNDPLNQAIEKLDTLRQPISSKRSLAATDLGAMYSAPDGIVLVGPTGAPEVISLDIISKAQWQAFKPESHHAVWYRQTLVVFYDTGTEQGSLWFDFRRKAFTRSTLWGSAAFVDARRNALFLSIGADIHQVEAGAGLRPLLWRSAEILRGHQEPYRAAMVVAETYPLTLRYFAGGVLRHTETVGSDEPFGLPSGYGARASHVEIEGTAEVKELHLADELDDFAGLGNGG